MTEFLFAVIPALIFGICIFGFMDAYFRRRAGEFSQNPVSWLGLLGALLALEPMSKLTYLLVGLVLAGPLWYFLYERSKITQPHSHPEALLLEFCTPGSIALSGGLSAILMALFLYSLGILGNVAFWIDAGVWKLIFLPFVGGSLSALVRRVVRVRKPVPIWVPYVFRRRLDGSGVWAEGKGLWVDEIILPIVITPFLWAGLLLVEPGWSGIFMFSLFLPTIGFYLVWAFLNRFWLRLVGMIDRKREMQFMAYELLIGRDSLAQWMGEIVVEWNGTGYVVAGLLPGHPELMLLKRSLESVSDQVDVSNVNLVSGLRPNPWFQLALIRKKRSGLQPAS